LRTFDSREMPSYQQTLPSTYPRHSLDVSFG